MKQITNNGLLLIKQTNMTTNEVLAKIKLLFSTQVVEEVIQLEKLKLEDGITVIESDSFEATQSVFIINEDEQAIPMPIGVYKLEDGRVLEVVEEGLIDSIGDAETTDEVEEEEVVDAAEEDETTDEVEEEEETNEDISREEFDALVVMVNEMKESMNLSKQAIADKETEIEALKVELSKAPATTKIKLGQTKDTKITNNVEAKPAKNSLGRIFQQINKNKQ